MWFVNKHTLLSEVINCFILKSPDFFFFDFFFFEIVRLETALQEP